MIFKAFEPHDLVGAFAGVTDWGAKLVREWRAEMPKTAGTTETSETPAPIGWPTELPEGPIGAGVSDVSVVPAFLLKKSSPWPFYWNSGPKRCGHSGLPGTMETWPSLATAATRRGHGCECQSKLGSSCQQGVCDVFFQAWSSSSQGIPCDTRRISLTPASHSDCCSANLASFMAKRGSKTPDTTETPGLKLYRKTSTMSLELLKFVQGISDFLTIWQSKAKAIHFARRPGLDLEWGHLSESFAADRSIETSVTLTFMVVRHSSLHLPKCQCTPNKGSVNCCHSSAQIVNL